MRVSEKLLLLPERPAKVETVERTYICFFLQKSQFECKAANMFEAKQKAIAHFKPRKSNRSMVHCHLADVVIDTSSIS